jgi:toxin-antitoxin system PIN domain toxin
VKAKAELSSRGWNGIGAVTLTLPDAPIPCRPTPLSSSCSASNVCPRFGSCGAGHRCSDLPLKIAMSTPDVNVLIYAFRTDSENHEKYKEWLESVINGSAAYGIAPQVLASVVRICTHPRIFARPSALSDAFAFCRVLLEQPNATVMTPSERHWLIFDDLCRTSKATGNLVQDAWFA